MCGMNIISPYYVNKVMFLTCHNKMRMALFDLQSKIVGWKITQVSEMIEDILHNIIYIYIYQVLFKVDVSGSYVGVPQFISMFHPLIDEAFQLFRRLKCSKQGKNSSRYQTSGNMKQSIHDIIHRITIPSPIPSPFQFQSSFPDAPCMYGIFNLPTCLPYLFYH